MARTEATQPDIAGGADKTKVFISYSRKDRDFVDRLVVALEAQDHIEVFRDTDDILPTEEWKERLERLIGEADTIVFCLSPDSTASDVCRWEADVAARLNKRIAPIVVRAVGGEIPATLAKLNYIFFTRAEEFDRSLSYLVTALDADIGWIREHTRLGELSRRWERSGKPRDQLLRGADLAAAETWLTHQPRRAPEPTESTLRYILTSRRETVTQRRRMRAVLVSGVAVMALIFAAWHYEQWLKEQIYWLTRVRGHVHTVAMLQRLKPQQPFKDCADCPEMIVVPAGRFIMGSPREEADSFDFERPQHEVAIAHAFGVSRFEVTFDEWDACAAQGYCPRAGASGWGRGRRPVINVSWHDAQRYAAWLTRITGQTYRLLSEAEWEYAARGGSTTAYPWGNQIGRNNANCRECDLNRDDRRTLPVGMFPANAFGLHDMHGNVFEWVEDCHMGEGYDGAPTDGSAWISGDCRERILRGGSWSDPAMILRSAYKLNLNAEEDRTDAVGFRVARALGL